MKNKERFMMYVKIAERAEDMEIYHGERFSLLMDIENADKAFNLRLEEWLKSYQPLGLFGKGEGND